MSDRQFLVYERTDYKGNPVIVVQANYKPRLAFRQALKAMGFRWNEFDGFWYVRKTNSMSVQAITDELSKA